MQATIHLVMEYAVSSYEPDSEGGKFPIFAALTDVGCVHSFDLFKVITIP